MNGSAKTPVHFWIVSIVATLWNAFGAADYVMSQMRYEGHLAYFTQETRDHFESFPAWMHAGWAIGVWAALIGSLLLLARSRHAVLAFTLSLAGFLLSSVYFWVLTTPPASMLTPPLIAAYVAYWAFAIGLFLYARRMRAKGVLR